MPTTCWVELLDQKIFAKTVLDQKLEIFVMYIATLKSPKMTIHLFLLDQVSALLAALLWNKTPTKILADHPDYGNLCSLDLIIELYKNTSTNKYAIKLKN